MSEEAAKTAAKKAGKKQETEAEPIVPEESPAEEPVIEAAEKPIIEEAAIDEPVAEQEETIVRTKRVIVDAMETEEAITQMELLGHSFYVFMNADTDKVNVVYKRKRNSYGLIEPEE